ncbi:MAG: hypothetical protein ACI87A_003461, partial [Planctomycetota bacterium]
MNTNTNANPSIETQGAAKSGALAMLIYLVVLGSAIAGITYFGKTSG